MNGLFSVHEQRLRYGAPFAMKRTTSLLDYASFPSLVNAYVFLVAQPNARGHLAFDKNVFVISY